MNISDIIGYNLTVLREGRDAPLYHWMSAGKAARTFNSDRLRPLFAHKIVGKEKGISLTRNPRYNHDWSVEGAVIRLTLNQTKLAQRYRIIPLDAEKAAAYDRKDFDGVETDRNKRYTNRNGKEMAEEYLIGIIEPLHLYIDEIFLSVWHNDYTPLMNALPRYLRKWKNVFKTDDKFFDQNYLNPRMPVMED